MVLKGTQPDARGRTQPALVGEVISNRSRIRDYEKKRDEYHLYGIKEYWIVDPLLRQVTVLIRGSEAWTEAVVRNDQTIPSLLLPGLPCRVAELWVGIAGDDAEE